MKAKELKIGDWVSCHGEILKIASCDMFMCSAWDENNDLCDHINYDDLSPILLTEEILEKNGWKEDDEIWGIDYTYGKLNAEVWQWGKEMVVTISTSVGNDVCTLAQIKYTHELQHLLWALGMDDDLKI